MTNLRPAFLILLSCFACAVHAESADRNRPIEITAHQFDGDEIKQTAIYTGAVEVHQGTLEILGNRMELVTDARGYRTITVTGKPVRIKERRDPKFKGIEEWVHAKSLKAVYHEKRDLIVLSDLAKVSRLENGLVKDSTSGDVIIYDLLHARTQVRGKTVAGKKTRMSSTLAPRDSSKTPISKTQTKKTQPKKTQPQKKAASSKRTTMTIR